MRAHGFDGRGDLLGPAHAADRFLGDDLVPFFGSAAGGAVYHLGFDDAGQMALIRMFDAA
jgi:hypothetical protein